MQLSEIFGFVSYLIAQVEDAGVLSYLQAKFVQGGGFMYPILGCLVVGLGFSIERLWTLSFIVVK